MTKILRRHVFGLLAALPFVRFGAGASPAVQRNDNELRCTDCGELIGIVEPPWRVDKVGTAWCATHAVTQPGHEPGKHLVSYYHLRYDGIIQ